MLIGAPNIRLIESPNIMTNKLKNNILAGTVLLLSYHPSSAQEDPRDPGGGTVGADCNGLGDTTTISNGRYYGQTEPDDPIVGGGLGGVPLGQYVDTGLSIYDTTSSAHGLLAGSSMRWQDTSSGTTGIYAGVTTKASCIESASLAVPTWGGSGRLFWDTNSGVMPDNTNYPVASTATTNASVFSCWNSGGTNILDFTYTLSFSEDTLVDGVYWETIGDLNSPIFGSVPNSYQILIDGVAVNGTSTTTPYFSNDVTDSSGGTDSLNHFYIPLNQALTGSHTITLRSTGSVDPALGDFAIMGCCPVPEPSTSLLTLFGTAALSLRRRR